MRIGAVAQDRRRLETWEEELKVESWELVFDGGFGASEQVAVVLKRRI